MIYNSITLDNKHIISYNIDDLNEQPPKRKINKKGV